MRDDEAKRAEYLWDPSAPPHPEVVRLERELAPLAHCDTELRWPQRRTKALPARTPAAGAPRSRRGSRLWLGLAASLVVVLGAGLLALLLRPNPPSPDGRIGGRTPLAEQGAGVAERYELARRALEVELAARRAALPPGALDLLERNLASVDAAIRDLEAARASGAEEGALQRLLEQRYRMRLELLRGVVELASEA